MSAPNASNPSTAMRHFASQNRRTVMLVIELAVLLAFVMLPWCATDTLGDRITDLMIFAIMALGLNVVVGYTGLLHLGIGAFYGIGAYIAAILTINSYPFQSGLRIRLSSRSSAAALAGLVLGSPTLRLRGDYLALVTLGFGEVVKRTLLNLEEITNGSRRSIRFHGRSCPRRWSIGGRRLTPTSAATKPCGC